MSGEVLIKAENVSKKFCKDLKKSLKYGFMDIGGALFSKSGKRELRDEEFWALSDVSFEVKRGECLGLIGHNGAGKSTLLKMLNGLIMPDKGQITINGKVGALIELGAGFNPILTGRENIYNNAAVLGFTKAETDAKLQDIIDFAEIDEFLDMPVQNYSSGMRVRLGFAVAAHMEPDVLLVDEVLAVGDVGFMLKCFNHMDKMLQHTAMILVSHSMPQVARTATKLLMLEKGKDVYNSDDVSTGITTYYNRYKLEIGDYKGSDSAEMSDLKVVLDGKVFQRDDDVIIEYGKDLELNIEIECFEPIASPSFYLAFYDREQRIFGEVSSSSVLKKDIILSKGKSIARVKVPNIHFAQGKYSITVGMSGNVGGDRATLFRYQSAKYFTVSSKRHGWAPMQFQSEWEVKQP